MMDSQAAQTREQAYSAGIMAQSFWFVEFKQYLKLRSKGYDPEQIKKAVIQENLFASPNEYRARRIFGYLSNRVAQLDEKGMDLFFSSDLATQKLLNLVCVLRLDRLFFEFLNEVYREKVIMGITALEPADGSVFFHKKEVQSEVVAGWTDATKKRLPSSYFNFMTDANLLTVVKKEKIITPPLLDISLEQYLEANGEAAIIKAITGRY